MQKKTKDGFAIRCEGCQEATGLGGWWVEPSQVDKEWENCESFPKKMQLATPPKKQLVFFGTFLVAFSKKVFSTRSFCCRNHRPQVSESRNVKEGISMIPEKIFWAILSMEAQRQNGFEVYYRKQSQ